MTPESGADSLAETLARLAEAATLGEVTLCWYGDEEGVPRSREWLAKTRADMIAAGGPFFFAVVQGDVAICEPGNGPTSEANGAFIEACFDRRAELARALRIAAIVDAPETLEAAAFAVSQVDEAQAQIGPLSFDYAATEAVLRTIRDAAEGSR